MFENSWADAGNGFAILFTVRNQDGQAPWSVVQDMPFANNIVRRAGGGIAILGKDTNHASAQMNRVLIANTLFEGYRRGPMGRARAALPDRQRSRGCGHRAHYRSSEEPGSLISTDLEPSTDFVYRDNIAPDNGYGVVGTGDPRLALATYLPGATLAGNVIPDADPDDYPAANVFPASLADVGFAGTRPEATSPCHHQPVSGRRDGRERSGRGPRRPACGDRRGDCGHAIDDPGGRGRASHQPCRAGGCNDNRVRQRDRWGRCCAGVWHRPYHLDPGFLHVSDDRSHNQPADQGTEYPSGHPGRRASDLCHRVHAHCALPRHAGAIALRVLEHAESLHHPRGSTHCFCRPRTSPSPTLSPSPRRQLATAS